MSKALTFTIPPDLWLSANRQIPNHGLRRRLIDGIHDIAYAELRKAGIKPIAGPVHADWTIRYPKGVRRDKGDATNAHPTTKAILDALVTAGVLEDDGPLHVVAETFRRGPNLDVPRLHEIHLVLTDQTVPF